VATSRAASVCDMEDVLGCQAEEGRD